MRLPEIVWTAKGEADLLFHYTQHEDRHKGLGDTFSDMVDGALELLRAFPEMAPFYEAPFRRLLLDPRDLALFFTIDGRRIVIHAIQSLRQDPSWIRRGLGLPS
ncbi:MAG: hypothetical protein ABL974_13500 [Prosthecobacter sp.]